MTKRIILIGQILFLSFLFQVSNGLTQEMEANYWFKKGINEETSEKKIECYLKAIEKMPKFVEAHYNLGLAYMASKQNQKAEEVLKRALDVNPSSFKKNKKKLKLLILTNIGSVYNRLGRYEEAKEALIASLALTKEKQRKAIIYNKLGQTCIIQEMFDEAIAFFEKGIAVSAKDKSFFANGIKIAEDQKKIVKLYNQGVEYSKAKQYPQAEEVFNQIVASNPSHKKAIQELEKIKKIDLKQKSVDKEHHKTLLARASTYMKEGNLTQAIVYLKKIDQIEPNNPEVIKMLDQAKKQQYQQLISEQELDNLYYSGIEKYKTKNYSKALENFEKVFALNENYKDVSTKIKNTKELIRKKRSTGPAKARRTASMEDMQNDLRQSIVADRKSFQNSSTQTSLSALDVDTQLAKKYYQHALEYIQNQDWINASIVLEKIKIVEPSYKNVTSLLQQVQNNINTTNFASTKAGNSNAGLMSTGLLITLIAGLVVMPVIGFLLFSPAARAR